MPSAPRIISQNYRGISGLPRNSSGGVLTIGPRLGAACVRMPVLFSGNSKLLCRAKAVSRMLTQIQILVLGNWVVPSPVKVVEDDVRVGDLDVGLNPSQQRCKRNLHIKRLTPT